MQKTYIILLLLLLNFNGISQHSFETIITSPLDEFLNDAIEDNEGDFVFIGGKKDRETGYINAYILKVSPVGDTILSKTFYIADTNSIFTTILLDDNGGYFVHGKIGTRETYFYEKMRICKLDADFNMLWEKSYHCPEGYQGFGNGLAMYDSRDNIVVATCVKYGRSHSDLILYKLDNNGDTLSSQCHHFIATQVPHDILEKKDSTGYIVFGSLFPQSLTWAQTVEIDTSLNIINIDSIAGNLHPPLSAKWLSDTTYIVSGLYTWPDSSPQDDDITVKVIDTTNNIQYEKFFGRKDTLDYPAWRDAIDFIDKSAIYIGGQRVLYSSFSSTSTYLQLVLLDSTLKVRGKKFYGDDANYTLHGVLATSDGGCIMYASRYDYLTQYEEKDIYLLKVMEDSIAISTSSKPVIKPKEVTVYPNPGINTLRITTALKNIQFEMYDMNGEKILSKEIENNNTSFDVSKIPSGIYLYKIYNSKKVYETGKWVKK